MVRRIVVFGFLLLRAAAPGPVLAQAPPRFEVGVRPSRVRVGDTFVLTVRLVGPGWPEVLDVEGVDGAEVVDVRDRSSAALSRQSTDVVVERDFVMRALRAGAVAPSGVFASWGADTLRAAVPEVEAVGSPVAWARPGTPPERRNPERERSAVRDQGVPPTATGRDADRERAPEGLYPPTYYPGVPPDRVGWQGGGQQGVMSPFGGYPVGAYPPYGSTIAGSPYAPTGWGVAPPGRGWAPSAAGDPWWPELIPRLEQYATGADDPMGMVRLEAGVTPVRVFQGQQVTLIATATFAPEALARLGSTPEFFPPSAGDAWAVEVPYAPPTPAAVGGRVQEAHTFMRAFFPVSPGVLTVEPTRLTYAVGSGGSAARPQDELVTDPLSVEVMPIPDRSAPPGWTGAVGRYRVAAWIQPEVVNWGEAALLTVEVAGAGNVRDLARPDPGEIWGGELRATGERAYVEVRDGVVGGVKTFSWLVVPVESGGLRIGPVIFSYFDPWLGDFGQVASGELLLEARPFPGPGEAYAGPAVTPSGPWPQRWSGRPAQSPAPAWGGTPLESAGPGAATGAGADPGEGPASIGTMEPQWVAGNLAELPSGAPGPEAEAQVLRDRVARNPGDGDAWLTLARVYEAGRPGDGWTEWALLSGLRHSPRHPGLRQAALDVAGWSPGRLPGLPRLPLRAWESGAVAALLGLLTAGLAGAILLRGRSEAARARGVVVALLAAAAVAGGEPWMVLRRAAAVGVVVDGPVAVRALPTVGGEAVSSVVSGTPLWLEERYGRWVRVEGGEVEGWVEATQVALP